MDQAIQMADSNDNVRSEPGCTNQGGSAAPVVTRLYVEKLPGLDSEAHTLRQSLRHQLGITALEKVRILQRYDFYHPGPEAFARVRDQVFSDPSAERVFSSSEFASRELPAADARLNVEYLPGQYDARAEAASQAVSLVLDRPYAPVKTARVYLFYGVGRTSRTLEAIQTYLVNPVESRSAGDALPEALEFPVLEPEPVQQVAGFRQLSRPELEQLQHSVGLAMLLPDLDLLQRYFRQEEQRDPSMAELKVLDTYWSDHCRHTTFTTIIDSVEIEAPQRQPHLAESYQLFRRFHGFGPCTLMDLALAGMRELRREGRLEDLEVSEEVNAASLHIRVDTPAGDADWLLMFKNETHNHPTEIEPYGGAATCLGGAIRDPLSGRAYVYQAMRLSGSGDPRRPLSETRRGKLPQRIITSEAARGYSSYGNQVGLATGYVRECYHPGFVAKRMEVGAVIGAVPLAQVRRERPQPGDIVLLVGGATGRDGIGGATGSSKGHTSESVREAAAEVQKGNPPEERALQRYFRRPEVAGCIKRSNDFGAGGIAVAVGELAEGLDIDLDRVPKKYAGLDGTELAISESQERMAIVADPAHRDRLIEVAARENLTATEVAVVGSHGRLRMFWQGEAIVDLSREFLDKNGAPRHAEVRISPPSDSSPPAAPANAPATGKRGWIELFRDLNCAGQQGLVEQFDSTIGARSVLLPFGGARGLTPAEAMVAKLPVPGGATSTVSFMAAGYNPDTAARSPYLGGINAVVEALCRISAAGADPSRVRLSLQEYFERLGQDPHRWGKPFAALLGAYRAQIELGTPAVGGKDSMSGSFEELSVPPTLAAFAVAAGELGNVISPEFKAPGRELLLLQVNIDSRPGAEQIVVLPALRRGLEYLHRLIREDFVAACRSIRQGGTAAAVSEMAFGNFIGARFDGELSRESRYGSFVLERKSSRPLPQPPEGVYLRRIGRTTEEPVLDGYPLDELLRAWQEPLAGVFPMQAEPGEGPVEWSTCTKRGGLHASKERSRPRSGLQHRTGGRIGMPRVLLPVFPGTNCEDESAARFQSAGAQTEVLLFRNKELAQVEESIEQLARQIRQAQILMLPGGFSAGDEPAGAGKYIAAVLRSPAVMEAVTELLERRDGLVLGICNGFQALLRTGLLPYGEYRRPSTQMPTLAPNSVGRHVSRQVKTVTLSKLSPWLMALSVGDVYTLPVSHGEGRYFSPKEEIEKLMNRGQVAFQYCDADGTPTLEFPDNPNGSMAAIEGISSPDGRVLGKMGHSERIGEGVAINVPGRKDQGLFRAGVEYFL